MNILCAGRIAAIAPPCRGGPRGFESRPALSYLKMAYIVKQKVHGKDYYYLRKSVREGKKVLSKNLAYLGKTREEAEIKAENFLKNMDGKKIEKVGDRKEMKEKKVYVQVSTT